VGPSRKPWRASCGRLDVFSSTTMASLGSRVASAENTFDGESVRSCVLGRGGCGMRPCRLTRGGTERATPATSGVIEAMTARSAVLWWASRGSSVTTTTRVPGSTNGPGSY